MKTRIFTVLAVSAAVVAAAFVVSSLTSAEEKTVSGERKPMGAGSLQSFATLDNAGAPLVVGVRFSDGALEKLPEKMKSHSRCHDVNGNGEHSRHECIGDYETILEIPEALAAKAEVPFRWISVNWNPEGHQAPAPPPYSVPHFDFHFFAWDKSRIDAIATGSCGELVDCADFKRGTMPIDPEYLPPGHIDVGAVVARMGNHLIDSQSPELQNPPAPFTTTFIYGAFDGELIFWEPMITLAYLRATAAQCMPIRMPKKVLRPGYYPQEYCVRFNAQSGERTVSLEKFVRMTAP
jgi:hypothetical protein